MRLRGADFLAHQSAPSEVFTPEDFSNEQQMIGDLAQRFLREELIPRQDSIERQEWQTTTTLLKRCGDLGLLGLEVPVEYGGAGLDKVSAMLVTQAFAPVASFGVSYGGQSGIGTLPLVYFATEELKRRYLPALCSGELFSAYALSEATSGSDAMAVRTTATRSVDGLSWILRGEKMWITNAAFADVFTTFAKVDGKDFTCFLVPKDSPGVSTGAEERKMGLRGSSTRTLILDNAKIPLENIVGEIGKGHHVAFNILNIGRAKIGAIAVGAGRAALEAAVTYAKQRAAFGRAIASFGAIQHKLAEMALRLWVVESMVYRTAAMMDGALGEAASRDEAVAAIREFALECSMLKVFGSEVLDYVVDEGLQIFGGYGYSQEYPIERYYRDARVNRIFEGTNEINRLLIGGLLLKERQPPLTPAYPIDSQPDPNWLSVHHCRKLLRELTTISTRVFGQSILGEQEVLMHLSDIAMEIYAMDSALCRAQKSRRVLYNWMASTFVSDAIQRIRERAEKLIPILSPEGTADVALVQHLTKWNPYDTIRSRRKIAESLLESPTPQSG
jgi:alkylation response protein AidB-like acyl-CoA dehydrogenase